MTLTETLIVATLLGLGIIAVAMATSTMRTDLKRARTQELLVILDAALAAYQQECGAWPLPAPAGANAGPGTSELPDDDADRVIAMLHVVAASGQVLDRVPPLMRVPLRTDAAAGSAPADASWTAWTVRDSWGQPLRCVTASSAGLVDREAVAAHHGRPIFSSAGEDGDFGRRDRAAAADNLRSDELPR